MQGEMYLKKLEELQKMISGMIADEKSGDEMPSPEMMSEEVMEEPEEMEGDDMMMSEEDKMSDSTNFDGANS